MEQPRDQKWDVGETESEDWFAERDWVAAGEKFRARLHVASQMVKHPALGSHLAELAITAAAAGA